MAVTLIAGRGTWEAGSSEELHALFSTCSQRLEPAGWGSRFPALLNELYQGELPAEHVSTARRELAQAREALSDMPPSAVVWDVEDPSRRPPGGEAVDPAIGNLSEYFLTNDGENLIEVIDTALAQAEREHATVTIRATDPASIPELGLRVGANVWGIGDRSRIDGALTTLDQRSQSGSRLPDLLGRLADGGLEGADLAEAHHANVLVEEVGQRRIDLAEAQLEVLISGLTGAPNAGAARDLDGARADAGAAARREAGGRR